MNRTRSIIGRMLTAILTIALIGVLAQPIVGTQAKAGDLTYSTLAPQTGDSDLVIAHKEAVAIVNLAKGNSLSNITATGTTTLTSAKVLDKVVINKAGSAESQIVLSDGATAFATTSTAAQSSLLYGVAISTGTLKVVNTGGTSANITISYR